MAGWGIPTNPQPATPPPARPSPLSGRGTRRPPTARPASAAEDSQVPNYLGWAIVCTIFFSAFAGVVGIVCSIVANRRALAGDIAGALRASRTAKTCCWISLIVGLVSYVLVATGSIHLPFLNT